MSDDETLTAGEATAEIVPVGRSDAVPRPYAEPFDAPDDDEWLAVQPRRGLMVRIPTLVLALLVVAAGGFWGGAALQKHHSAGSSTATTAALSRLASLARSGGFRGAGGLGGTGAFGSGGGAAAPTGAVATSGLVSDVSGDTVYVTDSSGNLVRVDVTTSTVVIRTAHSLSSGLQTGDTVTVRGSKAANGSIDATSIVATAPGVSTAGGAGGGIGGVGAG